MGKFVVAEGRVTPKGMVQSGLIWGWSAQKWSRYRSDNIFPIVSLWELTFRHSRTGNTKANIPIWPKCELAEILCLSWSPLSLMKIRSKLKALSVGQCQNGHVRKSRASNSEMNGPISPKFEIIRDFIIVLVTCKFNEDPIKSEVAIIRTTFSPL